MSRRAVILAGGLGTRLRPYTVVLPKPLMPVGQYPILEVIIRQLAFYKFQHITLAVNHQAEIIRAFFGDGQKWDIKIDYSLETMPLSTIAPLKLIKDLPENFVLMNGDVLTDLNFGNLYDEHVNNKRLFTISAAERKHLVDYGVLKSNADGQLVGFEEKPSLNYLVSMGVYAMNRAALDHVPDNRKYGFDNLMTDLLAMKRPVHVVPYRGYWLDIGRVDDYTTAVDEFEVRKSQLLPDGS
jgi:NDP-sugar pyrophosphorylase family protein